MKRLLDITLTLLVLVPVLPVGLAIVVILSLTGEREVFYKQIRIGKDNRRFGLLKFATMLKNSPKLGTGTLTVPNDPRVLPFGRLLRATKLNELPQLLNVLKGEMSLVGPRPLTPDVFGYYSPEVQRRILKVRPGLTGVGSIVFRDEERILARSDRPPQECHREEIAPHKGRLEVWYVERHSLLLDLKLLLLTAVAVLVPESRLHERVLKGIPQPAFESGK